MEAEARQKNDQLDELYGLIDSMQENVNQLESERASQQSQISQLK